MGENTLTDVIITGLPGSGKTYFVKEILVPELKRRRIRYRSLDLFEILVKNNDTKGKKLPSGAYSHTITNVMIENAYTNMAKAAESANKFYIYEFSIDPGLQRHIKAIIRALPKGRKPLTFFMNAPKKVVIQRNRRRKDHVVPDDAYKRYLTRNKAEFMALRRSLKDKLIIINGTNRRTKEAALEKIATRLTK